VNGQQGTQSVKAAFPYWNGRLAPVFDTARQMLVVTITTDGASQADQELVDGAPLRRAVQLAEAGIEVLLCGAISRTLHELIVARGITVLPFMAGDLQEMIACWVDGTLVDEAFAMPGCRRRCQGVRVRGGRRAVPAANRQTNAPDRPLDNAGSGVRQRRRGAGAGPRLQHNADSEAPCPPDNCGGSAKTNDSGRAD
jgi:predicted Fe-Mo cluster-binding NifX family protein